MNLLFPCTGNSFHTAYRILRSWIEAFLELPLTEPAAEADRLGAEPAWIGG
jgi:hypothetical protein